MNALLQKHYLNKLNRGWALLLWVAGFFVVSATASALENVKFLVLPPHVEDDGLMAAADDLAFVLEKKYGYRPSITQSNRHYPRNAIFLGDTLVTRSALRIPADLSPYGAVMRRGGGNRIFIRARSEGALQDGLYTFAQKALGARWYWPGDHGFALVDGDLGFLPPVGWKVLEPHFVHRRLWPGGVGDSGAFNRRNRLRGHFQFNHALGRLFSPELFDERPELFATRAGQQVRPRGSAGTDPQPHLALPEAARYAADQALTYFEANPEAESFALSINDNILYDESALTRAIVEPVEYFRGYPNYTDLVFTFMNRVAEMVFEEGDAWTAANGEPRYLTALAYYWAEQSPSFELHPRVMPVLTADRAQWHDSTFAAQDRALIERWGRSGAERVATWDYYMGAPYPYPRQMNTFITESIQHMAAAGLDVFFAQLPVTPGFDGVKPFLTAQLLWDPQADATALEAEFLKQFFGPAHQAVKHFYEQFAEYRVTHEGAAQWIKLYKDEAGIELFPKSFLLDRKADLEVAADLVKGVEPYEARVEVICETFRLTLDYAEFQRARRALVDGNAWASLDRSQDAKITALSEAVEDFWSSRARLAVTVQSVSHQSGLARHFRWLEPERQSDPTAIAVSRLAFLLYENEDQLATVENLLDRLAKTYSDFSTNRYPERFREMFAFEQGLREVASATVNRWLRHEPEAMPERFLYPEVPAILGWAISLRPTETLKILPVSADDSRGVSISGADAVSLFTDISVSSGEFLLVEGDFTFVSSLDNRTLIQVLWYGEGEEVIASERLLQFPISKDEQRLFISAGFIAPEGAQRMRLRVEVSRQYSGDFFAVESLEVSRLYEHPQSGAP